jgi:hypothetical protein
MTSALRQMTGDQRRTEKARLRTARPFDASLPAATFGSAGFDPSRNTNFMSQASFDYWKGKHPKAAAGLSFTSRDIDGDGIQEALVAGPGGTIAVNGWQLRPSKAKYTQPSWAAQGVARVQHRVDYYDQDLKSIYKQFGKLIVEKAFAAVIGEHGAIPATRKNGSPIYNAKGEQTYRGYSHYSKQVAKILVGNELDKKMMAMYADSINRLPQFAGWTEGFPESLANKESPAAKAAAYMRRSKEYKQELMAKLTEVIQQPNDEAVRAAIIAAVGIDSGRVPREAGALADVGDVPRMVQMTTGESGGQ